MEIDQLEALVKVYDNNCHLMIPYINEQTLGIQIENPYQYYIPEFPRTWKSTDVYREKLLRRYYMLPIAGITVELKNAADIQKVFFIETLYNNQVVMLYRVSTYNNGEMSGLFLTRD